MNTNTAKTEQFLSYGADRRASDMRVESGYPIWNLIGDWISHHYDDEAVIRDYGLERAEWEAAKAYYLAHKAVIDARLILNQEPSDEEIEAGIRTPEDFFAWADRAGSARQPS